MPPKKLGDAPSLAKRVCGAENCGAIMRGCDLGRHYKNKTDFEMLSKLKTMSNSAANDMLKNVDSHTKYMFNNNHSMNNLPKWMTHKQEKKTVPDWAKVKEKETNVSRDENQNDAEEEENTGVDLIEGGDSIVGCEDDHDNEKDDIGITESGSKVFDNESGRGDSEVVTVEEELNENIENEENNTEREENEGANNKRTLIVDLDSEDIPKKRIEIENSSGTTLDEFAKKIAEETYRKFREEEQIKANEKFKFEETWMEGDTMYQCRPCLKFTHDADVPQKFVKSRKANFGTIEKETKDGEKKKRWHIVESMKKHSTNDLHIWCCIKEEKVKEEKFNFDKLNKEAGMITIRNVVKALKHGHSSVDFQADNNLFHLAAKGKDLSVATKNNSRDAFFKIRDIVYEVVTEKQKKWFSKEGPGKIEDISIKISQF